MNRTSILSNSESFIQSIDQLCVNLKSRKVKKRIALTVSILLISLIGFAQKGNSWSKKNYNVTGNWSIEKVNNKTYLVLHHDFKTSKGPDLKIFVAKKSASTIGKNEAVEKHGIFIANLKSNKGSQRYLIPSTISINNFKSIVIHCEKYTKVWGAAAIL